MRLNAVYKISLIGPRLPDCWSVLTIDPVEGFVLEGLARLEVVEHGWPDMPQWRGAGEHLVRGRGGEVEALTPRRVHNFLYAAAHEALERGRGQDLSHCHVQQARQRADRRVPRQLPPEHSADIRPDVARDLRVGQDGLRGACIDLARRVKRP